MPGNGVTVPLVPDMRRKLRNAHALQQTDGPLAVLQTLPGCALPDKGLTSVCVQPAYFVSVIKPTRTGAVNVQFHAL